MSRHDDRISMRQMLDHARRGCAMAHGRKREDLDSDYTFQLALTRLVEIIGEAASRVSMSTREIDQVIEAHGGWPGASITDPKRLGELKGQARHGQ